MVRSARSNCQSPRAPNLRFRGGTISGPSLFQHSQPVSLLKSTNPSRKLNIRGHQLNSIRPDTPLGCAGNREVTKPFCSPRMLLKICGHFPAKCPCEASPSHWLQRDAAACRRGGPLSNDSILALQCWFTVSNGSCYVLFLCDVLLCCSLRSPQRSFQVRAKTPVESTARGLRVRPEAVGRIELCVTALKLAWATKMLSQARFLPSPFFIYVDGKNSHRTSPLLRPFCSRNTCGGTRFP
jgi:hypothetical protein